MYYSEQSQTICKCLATKPDTRGIKYWLRDSSYTGDNWLVLMINDGSAVPYFFLICLALFLIFLAIIVSGVVFACNQFWYPYKVLAMTEEQYEILNKRLVDKERIF